MGCTDLDGIDLVDGAFRGFGAGELPCGGILFIDGKTARTILGPPDVVPFANAVASGVLCDFGIKAGAEFNTEAVFKCFQLQWDGLLIRDETDPLESGATIGLPTAEADVVKVA